MYCAHYITVFVDAPHILQPVDLQGFTSSSLGAEGTKPASTNPEDIPRGWWRTNPERTVAIGVEESLQTLKEVLMKDTYDVRQDTHIYTPSITSSVSTSICIVS